VNVSFKDPNDCPIFRMGEVLLNYAEAKFEVGEFDQSIADATINKLRARGHVAPLVVTNIAEDPTRDADVDPVLWEIRRERSVELIAEGFGRAYDIRRWKKLVEYGADEKVGRWIKRSDYGNRIPVVGGGTEGYIKIFGEPLGVPEHYYLDPLPLDQLVLNPSLVQNPGWENN
jgi:starch-binding outer membrane protein, SusD/RagB family